MKKLLLALSLLLIGCADKKEVSNEMRRLENNLEAVNKNIEKYVDYIISVGEKQIEYKSSTYRNEFYWEMGDVKIYVSKYGLFAGTEHSCCDFLKLNKKQTERINMLYERWNTGLKYHQKLKEYNKLKQLENKLEKIIEK